jgi:iron complex transport system ATP-binding protein
LLRFLAGRAEGTGEIIIPAEERQHRRGERNQLIGYVSQDAATNIASTLSVDENLALYATNGCKSLLRPWRPVENRSMPRSARSISPARDQAAATLSGGQRQVLSISSMLIRSDAPRIVLFDEPLNHLDEENSLVCVDLMEHLIAEGRTLLIVQHDVAAGVGNANSAARTKLARLISRTISMNEIDP